MLFNESSALLDQFGNPMSNASGVLSDPLREYVSQGGATGYAAAERAQMLQQLPLPEDDLEVLLGNDIYGRMMNDPQVAASTLLLIMLALRRPLKIDPAFDDVDSRGQEAFDKSMEVRDYLQRALDNLTLEGKGIGQVLFEMLHNALPYGCAVAEINKTWGAAQDKNRHWLRSIKVKPRSATAFVVDAYFNLVGLAAYIGPGENWVEESKKLLADGTLVQASELGSKWELIERDKFAVLTLLSRNNDPRGKSWLRPVYNSWYQKLNLLVQADRLCRRFGEPIVTGTTAPNQQPEYPLTPDGTPDTTKPKITAQQGLLRVLLGLRAGDAAVGPDGTKFNILQNANDGGMIAGFLAYYDGQINAGITFQKLANQSSAYMARSAGEVHQDTLSNPVLYLKNGACAMLEKDIFWPLVRDNFGPEYRPYLSRVSLGRIAPEDFAATLVSLGRAMQGGTLHWSQLPELWAELDLPRADIRTWLKEVQEERTQITIVSTQNSKAPQAAPG